MNHNMWIKLFHKGETNLYANPLYNQPYVYSTMATRYFIEEFAKANNLDPYTLVADNEKLVADFCEHVVAVHKEVIQQSDVIREYCYDTLSKSVCMPTLLDGFDLRINKENK